MATPGKVDVGKAVDVPLGDHSNLEVLAPTKLQVGKWVDVLLRDLSKLEELDPLAFEGVQLAKILLRMITGAIAALVVLYGVLELRNPDGLQSLSVEASAKALGAAPDSAERRQLDTFVSKLVEARRDQRAHFLAVAQMILLNLLLPVLTAILGYVFGSRKAATT